MLSSDMERLRGLYPAWRFPMAYDKALAARVRKALAAQRRVTEREQFGGIGFLLKGNMAVGVIGADLLVRVGPDNHDAAMQDRHARPFAITGRPSRGWILVGPGGLKSAASLRKWVDRGIAFAGGLPAK
jgi:hypothetical protein